jgi:WD40 repeat protein
MRIAKLLGIGAAVAILLVAAGNFGQVGLSQGQIPPVRTLGFGGVASVAFSPDGRYLAVGTWGGSSVQLIDTSSWQVIRTFEDHTDSVWSVAFSPDGRLLASGSDDKTIKLWEVATGSLVRTLTGHPNWVRAVAFSPDGRLLASGSCGRYESRCVQGEIKLWDISDLLGR